MRTTLSVGFTSISLSLVDRTPRELLYLSAQALSLNITSSLHRTSVALTVRTLQVDNQLPSAVFPVLLQPSWTPDELANGATPPYAAPYRREPRRPCIIAAPL